MESSWGEDGAKRVPRGGQGGQKRGNAWKLRSGERQTINASIAISAIVSGFDIALLARYLTFSLTQARLRCSSFVLPRAAHSRLVGHASDVWHRSPTGYRLSRGRYPVGDGVIGLKLIITKQSFVFCSLCLYIASISRCMVVAVECPGFPVRTLEHCGERLF